MAPSSLDEAQQLYSAGEFYEAINRYKKIISGGAGDAIAYAGLARAYLKLKKPYEAFAAATKAVECDPSLATAHSALGEVYLREGKLHDAEAEFLIPVKKNQLDARSYLGLSRLYQATFNFKKAKVAIDKANILDPTDPDIRRAWIQTRPRSQEMRALEDVIASQSNYYSRAEKAVFRHRLAVMKDRTEHPERTCSLSKRPGNSELPLQPMLINDRAYPFGLEVRVNGQKSRLQLMTSGSGLMINSEIAQKARVQPIVRTDIDDLGDRNPPEGYVGFVRSIKIGNLKFNNCYVTVVERASPDSFFAQGKGTIGAEMFSPYLVDLDFPDSKLKLQLLPSRPATEDPDGAAMDRSDPDAKEFHDRYTAPEMIRWEQEFDFGSRHLVPVRVNGSPPKLFHLSATTGTFIAPAFARESTSLTSTATSPAYGVNGKIERTLWTGQVKLEFGNFYYVARTEPSIDLTMYSERAGTEISGILGLDALYKFEIKIDYRDGLIQIDDGQKRE
jgi:tetratricopeptide (TPR) repeat protein